MLLHDTLTELIELYLRRAGVKEETLERVMEHTGPIERVSIWLETAAPTQLTEDRLEDIPLEL